MTRHSHPMLSGLQLTSAGLTEVDALADLINRAYRGETSRVGWTSEADILDGVRTTPTQLAALLVAPERHFLLAWHAQVLVGCIGLEKLVDEPSTVQLGMLAVHPPLQNLGIGKWIIHQAEQWACAHWAVRMSQMSVIHLRDSLIAFYQRLGYKATDETLAFPVAPHLWQPKVTDLKLRILRKALV